MKGPQSDDGLERAKSNLAPPWKPGQSGNPRGNPSAGASVKQWFNLLQETPQAELEGIARNPTEKPARRAAAIQWLEILAQSVDLADVESYLDGSTNLTQLKERGVPPRAIKEAKVTTRSYGDDGEEVRREVKLSDRGQQSLDRIMDRTEGRPKQSVDVTSGDEPLGPPMTFVVQEFPAPERPAADDKTPETPD